MISKRTQCSSICPGNMEFFLNALIVIANKYTNHKKQFKLIVELVFESQGLMSKGIVATSLL